MLAMPMPHRDQSAVCAAPLIFLALLAGKVTAKILGVLPVVGKFRAERNERWYYTLLMSTGLTFGTISSLYGYSHGIIDKTQYSFLVAVVIASAVIPTMIANFAFMPRHLVPKAVEEEVPAPPVPALETADDGPEEE